MKAKALGDFSDAFENVKTRIDRFVREARRITRRRPKDITDLISMLRELRKETYEDLNQLQHEFTVLAAIDWLIENAHCPASTEWYCHLRQTSGEGEPDLSGKFKGRYIAWAEITASENPKGSIDTRIREALRKLHHKPTSAKKFYFVRTPAMGRRARTKVDKRGWKIRVVQLDV